MVIGNEKTGALAHCYVEGRGCGKFFTALEASRVAEATELVL